MSEMYGNLWISAHGDTPSKLWASAIKSLSGQQINHGLELLIKRGEKYAPSLPEFVALCKSYHPPTKQITKEKRPPTDKQKVSKHIADMRRALHS